MGEPVRIQYRGNTLNSKAGYNRSGLSRLVLTEKEEEVYAPGGGQEISNWLEEVADPRELNMLNQVPTGGKRKENHGLVLFSSRTTNL